MQFQYYLRSWLAGMSFRHPILRKCYFNFFWLFGAFLESSNFSCSFQGFFMQLRNGVMFIVNMLIVSPFRIVFLIIILLSVNHYLKKESKQTQLSKFTLLLCWDSTEICTTDIRLEACFLQRFVSKFNQGVIIKKCTVYNNSFIIDIQSATSARIRLTQEFLLHLIETHWLKKHLILLKQFVNEKGIYL